MANVITEKGNSKWLRIKDALCDGLAPKRAKQLGHVLENTRKEFVNRQKYLMENASASAVSTGNIATLNKVILPIIRRVLPNVIANERSSSTDYDSALRLRNDIYWRSNNRW